MSLRQLHRKDSIMTRIEQKHKEIVKDVPLTIVFVRHAQSRQDDGAMELGPALTGLGEKQADRLAQRLSEENFNQIYSSDLSRAWQTTQYILSCRSNSPWTVTSDLREVSHHHFAPEHMPLTMSVRKTMHEERLALDRFVSLVRRMHVPGEKILVVCHGNVIRSIVPIFANRRPEKCVMMDVNNTGVIILEVWSSGEAVLRLANCVKHLMPKQVT